MSRIVHILTVFETARCGVQRPQVHRGIPATCQRCLSHGHRRGRQGAKVSNIHARAPNAALRELVLERDGRRCRLRGVATPGALQIDHVIPYSRGGLTVASNLQVLCANCNHEKRDR